MEYKNINELNQQERKVLIKDFFDSYRKKEFSEVLIRVNPKHHKTMEKYLDKIEKNYLELLDEIDHETFYVTLIDFFTILGHSTSLFVQNYYEQLEQFLTDSEGNNILSLDDYKLN